MENSSIMPMPRCAVSVRPGTLADLPFIDELQTANSKSVGYMRTKVLEGKISLGHVIVAEDAARSPVGYCIGNDKYFKHDDIGVIYQLNVASGKRRHLVGATLIKAMFDRAAYGCKLFCCWCAQDIEANHFWESIGFIPLAFRAGSEKKARVHIFWQRRIREGDTTTPYWFPSETSGGAIRENRLVLPIPPGTHWADAKPLILPTVGAPIGGPPGSPAEPKALPTPRERRAKPAPKLAPPASTHSISRWSFEPPAPLKAEKPKRQKKPRMKNDPAHVAAVRELRDKHLELFNAGTVLPSGKYDVSRMITEVSAPRALQSSNGAGQLPAAA